LPKLFAPSFGTDWNFKTYSTFFSKKMAGPLVWKAFDLHTQAYSYMYRSPLRMETGERRITVEKLSSKHILWILANMVVVGYEFVSLYIFAREFYNPSGKLPMITFSIYVILFSANFLLLGTTSACLFGTYIESLFNQIIVWSDRLETGKYLILKICVNF